MITELNLIINSSLKDLVRSVFASNWFGTQRELVSLYAFGHLRRYCQADAVLKFPTQIALGATVPQIQGHCKPFICRDLVIWPKPRMTCWNEEREPVLSSGGSRVEGEQDTGLPL